MTITSVSQSERRRSTVPSGRAPLPPFRPALQVEEVRGRAALAAFRWGHHHRSAQRAPQPLPAVLDYLDWRTQTGAPSSGVRSHVLVCRDVDGTLLGRVCVTVDRAFLRRYGPVGFFGWFDAVDEQVARTLFADGLALARTYGVRSLLGPISATTADLVGIEGAECAPRPTTFVEAVPAHYQALLTSAGCRPEAALSCYRWTTAEHLGRGREIVARGRQIAADGGYRVRDGDLTRFDREIELLRSLYNASFAHNPLSVPLGRDAFRRKAMLLRRVLPTGYARVVEHEGSAVAFLVMVPELAEAVRLGPATVARLSTRRTGTTLVRRRTRSASVLIIGVEPNRMGAGIGHILVGEIVDVALRFGLEAVTSTWVHEDNRACDALIQELGSAPERTLTVFGIGPT